ncbi:uncharacterized protein LOC124170532 isoform X2 [Ischnura elegans]|uniref:uncharacterized protein LOC124170532 isoform X2 n=1 Tax=Ischnura elegans TaxID=197161 RepID=UPI001ED8813F|nr:uncharacterized protein LOC124170532 isoform X2 [Ischnura elegans]
MESSRRDCTEAGGKIEGQSQGAEIVADENMMDMADPEFSLARGLSDDDEYTREYEELCVTAGNVKTVAALKLYIHQCNKRIGEFDQELKHRDSAIIQLRETLSGVLNTVQRANEEGQSAEECVEALKTRVSSATEFLSNIYQVKDEDGDNLDEQDRSLTEICESSAFHSFPERSETSSENGVEKLECNHHCQHLKEINQIKEEVLHSLEHLQVPADILMKQRDLDLASNIGELSSQAHKYKCAHEDQLAQLHSTKEQSEIMMSKVLNKEEELIKLKSYISDLNVELKAMKDRCNKLEQECKSSSNYFSATDMNHEKTNAKDKSIQSFIDLNIMNRLLEISPCGFPNLSLSNDMPCDANVLRTEGEKCSAVQVNLNSSSLNYAKFVAKLGKGDGEETLCNIPSNSEVENQNVPSKNSSLYPSKIESNYSFEVKADLEMPVECDTIREYEGCGVNDMSSACKSNDLDVNALLLGSSSPEEVLLDLGTKARHLSVIERQLKIMYDREKTLMCQLKSAMDSCDKVEKRCRSAEKLAMDLQRDLEKLLCGRETTDTYKSGSLVDVLKNDDNEMPFITSPLHSQHKDENQQDKLLKDLDSSSIENKEFIPIFLHRFWNKMQLAFDVITKINEEKTDLFFPKKIEPLRASVENDICQLAVYLKRKDEVLRQARMLLEAECYLQNVKTQSDPTHQSNQEERESYDKVLKCIVDKNGSAEDILSSLSKLHEEMGAINTQVIKCMKYCMEKEHEIQTAELKMHHAGEVASLKQQHVLQLKNLMGEVSEKMNENQRKTEEAIMTESSRCREVEARDIEIKDSYKQELEAVWADVDEKHREALKQIFKRITAEQIILATRIYKESYDLKVSEEINLLRSVHRQEVEAIKAALEHEKELEVLHVRQEMSKNSKDYVNEMIKAVESGLKGLQTRCYEVTVKASIANETALDDLRKNIIKGFQGALVGFGETWLKKFEKEANTGEANNSEGSTMNVQNSSKLCREMMTKEQQLHSQDPFVNLRSKLISMSEGHIKEMAEWQFECMKELMEKLQSEQSRFKLKLLEVHWNNGARVVSVEDNADLIEKKSERYSVNQNIYSLLGTEDEAWINDIKALKKELEEKHAKEMESLRLYFEKKCAEVEKRYSEDVLTQRSIKHSATGSSEGSSNASIVGSAAELESDHFFLNPEDTLPSRSLEEHEKEGLDLQLLVNQGMSYDERRAELEAKIREELSCQMAEENEKKLAKVINELKEQHEEALRAQIAAEAEAYAHHVEEVTNAIKKCSEEEQEKFIRSHREMMDKFLEQHQKDLIDLNELHDQELQALQQRDFTGEVGVLKAEMERMHHKYNQELIEASQKLMQEHAEEVSELKKNLKAQHEEEKEKLVKEIKKMEEKCLEVKHQYETELKELRESFDRKVQEKVEQSRLTNEDQCDQIQALFGDGGGQETSSSLELCTSREHLKQNDSEMAADKEQKGQGKSTTEDSPEDTKKMVTTNTELANPVLLEQQVDFLKHKIDSDITHRFSQSECMGRDLVTLKLQVNQLEQSKNMLLSRFGEAEVEIDNATSVTVLQTDLDKLLKDRDKWKKATHMMRILMNDLVQYTNDCESELNDTLVQNMLRLSGVSDDDGVLTEGSGNRVLQPRRVHIAPERLPNILNVVEVEDGERGEGVMSLLEDSGEGIRIELKQCLARLRAEASALLGLSSNLKHPGFNDAFSGNLLTQQELIDKITYLEDHLKKEVIEKDKLKVELHEAKALCEGNAATISSLLTRATQAEGQLTAVMKSHGRAETVAEGYGEGSGVTHFSGQQQKIANFGEKVRMILKEYQQQGGSSSASQTVLPGTLVAQLVEELCVEGDRLTEEARKEREDLQLQVEAADKQLRSTRAFLEEQAVEREQEREEYQRELTRLNEALEGREREKVDRERISKEEMPQQNQKEGQDRDPSSRDTVERLEQHSKDLTQLLEETTAKKEELEGELKAAVDKIWDLREIIRELEGQVEGNLLLEKDLRSKNERLAADMVLQSKKLNDLIEELESLRSSLGYSIPGEMENEGHTALLEEALRKHCQQVEQAKALGPSLKDLTCKLLDMGRLIDKKTKEIEAMQVTPAVSGNCSSPSEDVSIREQLEQATWRSESPAEDEVSELGAHPNAEEASASNKESLSYSIPRAPLSELVALQEKLSRHFQAQEPLRKKIHDLEMQLHSIRKNEEELMTEREVLQSQVEKQLLHNSELQARLDEARQRGGRQIHCVTVTPLPSSPMTRSPIGSPSATPDQPFFCCAALAEARHEIENITECLEKKELELTQLKGALENSKKIVAVQEKDLMNKAKESAQTFEKLREFERLKSERDELQVKLSHRIKTNDGDVPFSILLDALVAEKNEEIDFLNLQVVTLKEQLLLKASKETKSAVQKEHSKGASEVLEQKSKQPTTESTCGEEVEALREAAVPELSVDVIHRVGVENQWLFHSTKLGTHISANTLGLTSSLVIPCDKAAQDVTLKPLQKEDIPETISLGETASRSQSNVRDTGGKSGDDNFGKEVEGNALPLLLEAGTQTSSEINDGTWEKLVQFEALEIKLSRLSQENKMLREKINWHSEHLEKHLEICSNHEAQMNVIISERDEAKNDILKCEQEISNLRASSISLQEEILKQKEENKRLSEKVQKYCRANKEQHMLLKADQQERKEIKYIIDAVSLQSGCITEPHSTSSPLASPGAQSSSDGRESDASQRKAFSPTAMKTSIREAAYRLVEEVKHLRSELTRAVYEKDQLRKSMEISENLRSRSPNSSNARSEKFLEVDEDDSSPADLGALEQMMEKVQQEGIEVLSLSERAASRKSTSGDVTPAVLTSPVCSPLPLEENASFEAGFGSSSSASTPQKNKVEIKHDEEQATEISREEWLLMRIRALEDELARKEREEKRKRDWLQFQEREGHAGWMGVVEAVGVQQRHEFDILERLGEQRNARARLEAEVTQLREKLSLAEAEARKTLGRLGMERSHVIRLEAVLKQEKSNFSQLQVSLDTERKRCNMTKELNSKVVKALKDELTQLQGRCEQLKALYKQEKDVRQELEMHVYQLQMELQSHASGAGEEPNVRSSMRISEEQLKLKKIEEDCERKALEMELEEEKRRRVACQQELANMKTFYESRFHHERGMAADGSRWTAAASQSNSNITDSSFNAEGVLQDLQGVNAVLEGHLRHKDDYQTQIASSIETERNFLDVKCCHLEQEVAALRDMLAKEQSARVKETGELLRDQQAMLDALPHLTDNRESIKLQQVFQKLYANYWRSERNRKALAWQKCYFLCVLETFQTSRPGVSGKIHGKGEHSGIASSDGQGTKYRSRSKKSFRVVVWGVIATIKMRTLVIRAMIGIHFGSRSLLEGVLQPTHPHSNAH